MGVIQRHYQRYGELIRFGVVGVLTNALGFCLYLLITSVGSPPKLTMSILYAIGLFISFWQNRNWVFRHNGKARASLARFLAAHACAYGINYTFLSYFHDRLGYPDAWVQFSAMAVMAIFLFLMFKFFVFPKHRPAKDAL